jgi:hypothetical protein
VASLFELEATANNGICPAPARTSITFVAPLAVGAGAKRGNEKAAKPRGFLIVLTSRRNLQGVHMKKILGLIAAALLTFVLIGPAFAQQQPPKAAEVPEAKKQEAKGPEGQEVRKAKKRTSSAETQNPKGLEDPAVRKEQKTQ